MLFIVCINCVRLNWSYGKELRGNHCATTAAFVLVEISH